MAALGLFYLVVAWALRSQVFSPATHTYTFTFENVNGLLEGDPLMVRGYPSGRVISILPGADEVEVEVELDARIALHEDAIAEIQVKELMGGKQISISPGRQGTVLPPNGSLRGRLAMDFSSSFSRMGAAFQTVQDLPLQESFSRLDTFASRMEGLLQDWNPDELSQLITLFQETARGVNRLTRSIDMGQVDSLMRTSQQLAAKAGERVAEAEGLLEKVDQGLLPKADSLMAEIPQSLALLNQSLESLNTLLSPQQEQPTMLNRLMYDPGLSEAVDSTLYHLNKTLEQIHNQKVIVGFRRKN